MRNVIQSFKKVLNDAPTSRPAATKIALNLVKGVDSAAAGQTGPIDADVPTGSVVKFIEIQFSAMNLVTVSAFMHISVQKIHSGQSGINANTVGGNPQRNQVHFQSMYSLGPNQNNNRTIRFKIPKKFQRVREGDVWQFVYEADQIYTGCVQVIYKFYR